MAMINYADKVALNSNSGIADINKCNATDMNEIKTALNNYVQTGWYSGQSGSVYSFVSWNASVRTGVIASSLDVTGLLSVGMKVKFTQSATVKFGIITAITSTQITLFMGTDYSLNNSAISNLYYSMLKAPYGFPLDTDKWSIAVTDTTNREQTSPTKNQWYNLGGIYIDVPIGAWSVSYSVMLYAKVTSSTVVFTTGTLSTANNTESDLLWTTRVGQDSPSGTLASYTTVFRTRNITLTSNTRFYINSSIGSTAGGTAVSLQNPNAISPLIIKAICVYL